MLVAPGIQAEYIDEIMAGVELAVVKDVVLGVTYQHRRLGRVIEDVSTDGANTYIIANPGEWSADEESKLAQQIATTTDATEQGAARSTSSICSRASARSTRRCATTTRSSCR